MTDTLTPGERFEVKPIVVQMLRPRGLAVGQIVADAGAEWKVLFDGTKSVRRIFKAYLQRQEAA